jgi:hypothetical protein
MSSTLVYEPVVIQKNFGLDDELKFVLRKAFSDGRVNLVFSQKDTDYLRGLRDAGIKGANELIDAINEHEQVRVYEEY